MLAVLMVILQVIDHVQRETLQPKKKKEKKKPIEIQSATKNDM